ncbi:MAG: glycosyltransferase [Synechococcales bacterium]|nr:glycosyltransferase [Synechococcales bacterium]
MPNTATSSTTLDLFLFLEIFEREGGIQSYVQDILQAYLALPNRPTAHVFSLRDRPNGDHPFQRSPLQFYYFRRQWLSLGRLQFSAALLLHLLRQQPRRVFCGHILLARLTQVLCGRLGIPYTVLTYGKEVWQPLPEPVQQALRQADEIWTISRYTRDRACAANHLDPNRFKLLPCAVDETVFTPGSKSHELLDRYQLHEATVLMTVARLWPGDAYKGVDVTIRALAAIAQAVPNVKYLVIGRGDDQPRLAQLAADLGVGDRVVFAGFVPIEQLRDHYRLADAYVMPSQEGFGIVYLEAMACGVPVLAGDDDGSADPLQDGALGWRVPHRDPEAVAVACIEMLQKTDRRCDGEWLRQQAVDQFGKAAFRQYLQTLITP